jgi:hypothetical protein
VLLYGVVIDARDNGEFFALAADWGDFGLGWVREDGDVAMTGEVSGDWGCMCMCLGDVTVRGESGPVYRWCCWGGCDGWINDVGGIIW